MVAGSLDTAGAVTFSVSDSGNIWSSLALVDDNPSGGRAQLFYAVAAASAADTVSLTTGSATPRLAIHEFSNVNTIDKNISSTGTGASQSSGSVTTTQAAELLFGYTVTVASGVGNASISAGSGYTPAENLGANFITEYQVVSVIGSYSASSSVVVNGKGVTNNWLCQIATFFQQSAVAASGDYLLGGKHRDSRFILPGRGIDA